MIKNHLFVRSLMPYFESKVVKLDKVKKDKVNHHEPTLKKVVGLEISTPKKDDPRFEEL